VAVQVDQEEQKDAMSKVSGYISTTVQFLREVKVELQKVTFPSRQETVGSTAVVLVLTIVIAIYLGLSDWALAKVVKALLHIQ
jgi:preprotein translocase subunit SecE